MKIELTYDKKLRPTKRLFRPPLPNYQRITCTWSGDTESLQKAIIFIAGVETNGYFKLEEVYGDGSREEIYFSTLVMHLRYSAKQEGRDEAEEKFKIRASEQEIERQTQRRVKSEIGSRLDRIRTAVLAEVERQFTEDAEGN